MVDSLDDLYQELIVDHYKNPRCRGTIPDPSSQCALRNPLCGDEVTIQLTVENGIVQTVAFEGKGCAISQASASLMGELCKGKPVSEVREYLLRFTGLMKGDLKAGEVDELGDAAALQGVRKFAARIRCAMLSWEALGKCLEKEAA